MANPLTSSQFVKLLDEQLREVFEDTYKELPSMIPDFYTMLDSDSAWEEFYSVGAVPDIPEFNGKLSYLPIAPGYHQVIEPKVYAAGVQSERKLLDDKKYGVLENMVGKLAVAANRTRDKLAVRTFSNAFSTAFDFQTSEEGVSLCSNSHTTKAGTSTANGFDNLGTSPLSGTSVAATRIAMKKFRNDISERIAVGDNLALVVPEALRDTAMEIVGTTSGLDRAEGNINPQHNRYKVMVAPRLDDYDTDNWFLVDLDRMKESLLWFDRIAPEFKNTIDFETYMVKHAVYFRCAYGFTDWRWIYGHQVS